MNGAVRDFQRSLAMHCTLHLSSVGEAARTSPIAVASLPSLQTAVHRLSLKFVIAIVERNSS